MKKLPNKLSQLMRLALNDLYKAERSKNVAVDMSDWVIFDGYEYNEMRLFKRI